ncbi:MAG: transposase [Desulfovibrio sp.]|nr:transposase [Desulfovibrio sp.]
MYNLLDKQNKEKKNIYSIHEQNVACIAKGKDGKKFKFGSKSFIVMTKTTSIIICVKDFQENPFDGKTLKPSLDMATETVCKMPKNVYTDRGYRGAVSAHPCE